MRIDHGRSDVGMAEQLLDGSDIVAGFQEMHRKTMPKRMYRCPFGYTCFQNRLLEGLLED